MTKVAADTANGTTTIEHCFETVANGIGSNTGSTSQYV